MNTHTIRLMRSHKSPSWATPKEVYQALNSEFHFDFDPCPLNDAKIWDGRLDSWAGKRVYCNPPYGRHIGTWLAKASEADVAVYLLPSRTGTKWWHEWAPLATEIRFIQGRLKFGDGGGVAPFDSVILIYGA